MDKNEKRPTNVPGDLEPAEEYMKKKIQQKEQQHQETSTARMGNLDLLRCLAMMMVVVLHYLGKGQLLPEPTNEEIGSVGMVAWALESLCIVAVNVYMMISGYFLSTSNFKLSRLLKLWLQVWVYSVGIGVLAVMTGILPATEVTTHYFLSLLFPISMGHYWFMTAYIFLYLLLPLVGVGLRRMNKEQMQLTIGLLLVVFCLTKTVLPIRLEEDGQGYDCLWYLCVFVVAAYIRKYGISFLECRAKAVGLYIAGCMGVLAEILVLRQIYLRTGSLDRIVKISLEYNHLFPFLAALGLFGVFLKIRLSDKPAKVIRKIAPYTLGVYLLHENMGVRYAWQNWLGAERIVSVSGLLLGTLAAVVCVFLCGIVVDMLRTGAMKGLHWLLGNLGIYRKLLAKIEAVDGLFVNN